MSTELFLFAVGALGSTIGAMAAIIHRLYRADNAELKQENKDLTTENVELRRENAEQKERLYLYGLLAPNIVAQVRAMFGAASNSPPPSSNDSTGLPYPYGRLDGRSRPIRRRPRQIGGPQ